MGEMVFSNRGVLGVPDLGIYREAGRGKETLELGDWEVRKRRRRAVGVSGV